MTRAIAIALILTAAAAAPQARDVGLLVNLDVGFNTAYRDGSWVPIDVFIENKQRDFDGWAEVRVYDSLNALQSPTYRVPADCPQNSNKRFRLYAWIDGASRVEALLYENDRIAVDAPAYVEPRPIDPEDFLSIIMDDDPLNYQFLYTPLQSLGESRRLSRKDLGSGTLNTIPDQLAALEAVDFVIVGDVDLSRVPHEQRRVLIEYVEAGGTLIVFTGAHAQRVRDSWLAPHLGVTIESIITQPEPAFRAAVFGGAPEAVSGEARVCTTANLLPSDDALQVLGKEAILAAKLKHGSGWIITLAVDAASHALQSDQDYLALWRDILASAERRREPLNTALMDVTFINNLPQVSGVTIRPVSDVLLYLGLYIGVGIVANWIFWSRMGRREYAWLTLLLVSFSFTAYAVMSGTSGIEGRESRHVVSLMHLAADSTLAHEYTLNGILSARVTEINEPLPRERHLAREIGVGGTATRWGVATSSAMRPFKVVEGDNPAVEGLRIGANEVRGYSTSGYRRLDGGFEGRVRENGGELEVEVVNRSGIAVSLPMLYWRGDFFALEYLTDEDKYVIPAQPELHEPHMQTYFDISRGGYWGGGFYTGSWHDLISYMTVAPLMDELTSSPNPYKGPYFVARVTEGERNTTLLLAEIGHTSDGAIRYPLAHRLGFYTGYMRPRAWSYNDWQSTVTSQPVDLYISIAGRDPERMKGAIEIELTYQEAPDDVELTPLTDKADWQQEHIAFAGEHPESSEDFPVRLKRYRIENPARYIEEVSGDLRFVLKTTSTDPNAAVNIHVRAEAIEEPVQSDDKEWPGWR